MNTIVTIRRHQGRDTHARHRIHTGTQLHTHKTCVLFAVEVILLALVIICRLKDLIGTLATREDEQLNSRAHTVEKEEAARNALPWRVREHRKQRGRRTRRVHARNREFFWNTKNFVETCAMQPQISQMVWPFSFCHSGSFSAAVSMAVFCPTSSATCARALCANIHGCQHACPCPHQHLPWRLSIE